MKQYYVLWLVATYGMPLGIQGIHVVISGSVQLQVSLHLYEVSGVC